MSLVQLTANRSAAGIIPPGRLPPRLRRARGRLPMPVAALAAVVVLGACGSSSAKSANITTTSTLAPTSPATGAAPAGAVTSGTPARAELSPPGDIPDSVAYVRWTSPNGHVRFTHPEGWSQVAVPGGARFSDKLNSVTVTVATASAPSVATVKAQILPTLGGPGRATRVVSVGAYGLPAGPAVRIIWQVNSTPNAVTGKIYRDEVVTYLVGAHHLLVRMDLSGTVGSDNVDPYRKMSSSLVVS